MILGYAVLYREHEKSTRFPLPKPAAYESPTEAIFMIQDRYVASWRLSSALM